MKDTFRSLCHSTNSALVIDPSGKQIEQLSGPVCPFSMYYLPARSGLYYFRLGLLRNDTSPEGADKSLPPESYEIRIDELREATDQDKILVAANQSLVQGYRQNFRSAAAPDNQSTKKYEEAISLFRDCRSRDCTRSVISCGCRTSLAPYHGQFVGTLQNFCQALVGKLDDGLLCLFMDELPCSHAHN